MFTRCRPGFTSASTSAFTRCAVFAVAGVVCFALLGIALSHAIPNPESAPAYVNAVFLPQILIAGVSYDASDAPNVIHDIAQVLPLTHLVDQWISELEDFGVRPIAVYESSEKWLPVVEEQLAAARALRTANERLAAGRR